MPPEVELCAVQLPRRETRLREKPFVRLPTLVQTLTESLRPYLHEPFAFFGHSMGALISFELLRELRRARLPGPVHLFVSGHRAPDLPDPDPPIHQFPAPAMVAELRRRYDTPETLIQNPELLELFLPLLRADLAVCETYLYSAEEALDSPITVYGGLEDPKVSHQELKAWGSQTRGAFDLQMFPGKHFFLQTAEASVVQSLGRALKRVLNSGL
jgi:medium-chain acyl-[acyl-carrier-protein] hydrolase